jgi:hypothetical protein
MKLVDRISVRAGENESVVELLVGDLSAPDPSHTPDILVVSAFPDDYAPTSHSLIGALARAGTSVAELAREKDVDLREYSSCWLSKPLPAGAAAGRILCFEPAHRGRAPELAGDVFRSIFPFTAMGPRSERMRIAMPLLASGDQGEPRETMLSALVGAALEWLAAGLPVAAIRIVIRPGEPVAGLAEVFRLAKESSQAVLCEESLAAGYSPYDLFLSYSHQNVAEADFLVRALQERRPELRVFLDRLELNPGAAWQQHIFDALEDCRKVICLFSPDYLGSPVCIEEYHIARLRHRESAGGVLLPIYVRTAPLPTYMRIMQYEDAREADETKLTRAAERILQRL